MPSPENIAEQFWLLDYIPTGAFVLQKDFRVVFWNSRLEDWTGIARAEILGKPIGDFFPHLNAPKYSIRIQDVFTSGAPVIFSPYLHQYIIPVTLPDKQMQIQAATVTRLPAPNRTEFYVLCSLQDVTELSHRIGEYRLMRDQAQKEIKERMQAEALLKESEDRLRRVLENMPVMMLAFNEMGKMTVWNRECERVTGYSAAEILGNAAALTLLYPDRKYRKWALLQLARRKNEFYNLELTMISKDGTPKIIAWSNASKHFPIPGWTSWATGVDVTERKQAEEAIRNAQKAAENANQAKSTFLANMSHEFRTPLNAILGFAQLLARSHNLATDQRENLAIILQSGEHLLTLINQVLDLSKIEAGKMTLTERETNLYRLIDDVIDLFRLKAEEKGLQLTVERTPLDAQCLYLDDVKLRQVLMNLLSNAIKFTHAGRVTVRAQRVDESSAHHPSRMQRTPLLRLDVEDTGPGMTPQEREHLFEAFVQTRTGQSAQEGTGLGLSISWKFIELMGGHITVTSEIGCGSCFTVVIPFRDVERREYPHLPSVRHVRTLAPNQPTYRILVADDTWNNRQLLIKLLEPLGFDVCEASNGQQAVELWETWLPHLIVMDIRMPVMNGYDAIRRIRELETPLSAVGVVHQGGLHRTIIIATTASGFDEERNDAFLAGCDDFLRKPFTENELVQMMRIYLGVQFVYEESAPSQEASLPNSTDIQACFREALAMIPADLLTDLEYATMTTDIARIMRLLDSIREYHALCADILSALANEFDYAKILTYLQQGMK